MLSYWKIYGAINLTMQPRYDTIGKTYTRTRAADPRILDHITTLIAMDPPARILDIGAGTGNYSYALAEMGYTVEAVEPSPIMRAQAKIHPNLSWHATAAESMDFADGAFDAVVMTLCIHHLADWQHTLKDALRVSGGGPLVIFAFDIEHEDQFWMFDYFPQFLALDQEWTPTIRELDIFVAQQLNATAERFPFPLPADLVDHFAYADWAHPEVYLDENFRNGISTFSKLTEENLNRGLEKLSADLQSGVWQERYGAILKQKTYDRGYLFVRIKA